METIDWKAELRRIEREFDGLPPEPSPEERRAERETVRRAEEQEATRHRVRGALVRVALVVVLAAALPFWPYTARCGTRLAAHGVALVALFLAAVWAAVCAWRRRLPRTYAFALVLVLWALALGAQEVLPRVGYAFADPARPERVSCG